MRLDRQEIIQLTLSEEEVRALIAEVRSLPEEEQIPVLDKLFDLLTAEFPT